LTWSTACKNKGKGNRCDDDGNGNGSSSCSCSRCNNRSTTERGQVPTKKAASKGPALLACKVVNLDSKISSCEDEEEDDDKDVASSSLVVVVIVVVVVAVVVVAVVTSFGRGPKMSSLSLVDMMLAWIRCSVLLNSIIAM